MNSTHQQAAEAATGGAMAAGKITMGMTQGGAATMMLGGLTLNEAAIIAGVVISVVGLAANILISWYWQAKRYRLEEARLKREQREVEQEFKEGGK
ncbi:MAG: HP1 family phage holin [Gammaproteobacteria bacterium]|jgi:hypothetical protein|nr:HP1 family phage holin [Gammaproteobacteria bacterium]